MASGIKRWLPGKGASSSAPGSDLSGVTALDLIDVTLVTEVTGQSSQVADIGLGFSDRGLTVHRPDGSAFVTIPWPSIVEMSTDVPSRRFEGLATGVALDVQSDRRRHRFLVPHVTPEALTGSLAALSSRYGSGAVTTAQRKGRRRGR